MDHNKKSVHILITAGHAATTALATIQKLHADKSINWNISWIGPKQAFSGAGMKPFELDLFPSLGVAVYPINAGKLQSKFTKHTIPALIKLPIGFIQSMYLLYKIKPQVVLSFGGFAAFPVVIASWLNRIPVVLHEQTVAVGLSNKLSSYFARKITLARKESEQFFYIKKTVVVGNPLMEQIEQVKRPVHLPKIPTIYITGGSRGAQRINSVVFHALPSLLEKYTVIHQTGALDFEKATSIHRDLEVSAQKRYEIYPFINPTKLASVYDRASILIGRAGANTVSEAMALSIPSIFIPIPWTRMNEQGKNAQFAENKGVAYVLHEKDLTVDALLSKIKLTLQNWNKMVSLGKKEQLDREASRLLIKVMVSLIS